MSSRPFLSCASLLFVVGCLEGEATDIVVTLELDDESFRDLPVLASGRTSLLGQDVPDSHGELAAIVRIAGAERVVLEAVTLAVDVDGAPLDLEVQRVTANDVDAGDSLVGTVVADGDGLRVHFRAKQLAEIVQPQGAPYLAQLEASWREDAGVLDVAQSGVAPLDIDAFVAASINAGSFDLVADQPRVAVPPGIGGTAASLRASVEVKSGLTVDLRAARFRATFFGLGDVPAIGLALVDQPALQVDGSAAAEVAPGEVLEVYTSSDPTASPAPEDASGTAATTGDVAGGKALVTLELDYEPSDGTAGVTTDVLSFVVDVP